IELCDLPRYDSSATLTTTVDGLLGAHPRLTGRSVTLRLDEVLARTHRFRRDRVPGFRAYQRLRNELVAAERDRLRLAEYRPKVMSAFVRNRLLDDVYLPLIGDNLAKQLGATGDARRTDQSGLLLLISPPGYGKTTLMEYVASRLGLVFVKVNGPALGHDVTSVDPADAPNATARQEVEKISFALEQGNNVLLYLDDIQHTSPELLQKFISLCDAQRRMEGVWEGRTRTYDLRGKRFAVCMAGNPYTEQGKRFRIPDMLANRADVWNLGDVLSGKEDLFALSYVENSLTSNPVLAPLVSRERSDVDVLVRMARGDGSVRADQLSQAYSATELEQILAVLRKLLRVQRTVLANNQAYIASAAQADASRTEPPFQLQGSYRNMTKLAERIVPAMNDAELEALIDDHYAGEAQTLTSGAEANLLKLAELRGRLSEDQARRWADVKAAYLRAQALGGDDEDPMSRAVGAVGLLADRVGAVETAIGRAAQRLVREEA
ncbi:AAA family ATPase, partial [Amycolatopsis sp. NPDC005961]|uniref:AAA family ATPase n=1 Tax=Amycolatopsis sp. NPDC005961 TaxID=3156720 RepID=UPI0033E779D2